MTVTAPYLQHAKRLFEHNLNTILFDCSRASADNYYNACENSTLWHDLDPILTDAVGEKVHRTEGVFAQTLLSGELHQDQPKLHKYHPVTNFLCQKFIRTQIDFVLRNVAFGLAEAFDNSTIMERRNFLPKVYRRIASMFRRYWVDYSAYMVTIHLKDFYYEKDYLLYHTEADCRTIVAGTNLSANAMVFAASVISSLGMTDFLHELNLGQFLTIGSTSLKAAEHLDKNEEQTNMYNMIADLLPTIMGNASTAISANVAYSYLAMITGYPENLEGSEIKCNIRSFIYIISDIQPCLMDPNSTCCQFEKVLSQNEDIVLRLMKYIVAPTVIPVREKSEKSETLLLSKSVKYHLRKQEPVNTYPVIVACKYGRAKLTNKCNLFSRLYSTSGIGYTFNNEAFSDMFRNSSQNYAFYKEIYEQENDSYSFEDILPRKTLDYGKPQALEFYVSHLPFAKTEDSYRTVSNRRPLLKIHDPILLPDLRNSDLELEPGMHYDISVIPTLTVTDKAGLTLSETQRNCRPKMEEGHLKIFKGYSKSSCLIECKLKKATELCNCIPWDYPRWPGVTLCKFRTAKDCFNGAMNLQVDPTQCTCPNDCAHTQYALMPIIKPLSPSKLCAKSSRYDI